MQLGEQQTKHVRFNTAVQFYPYGVEVFLLLIILINLEFGLHADFIKGASQPRRGVEQGEVAHDGDEDVRHSGLHQAKIILNTSDQFSSN